ncbi:DUF2284 domain-containing protein [Desulfospira joergensenii]|uniref:DUF2284 domain-containing protein n=1 Tax=Desulfospira joergensenii TaxID=53329 RepID=UPI0003B6FD7E|nr:DUF2284 domain-containing protein [Desulfospira joergensenii]
MGLGFQEIDPARTGFQFLEDLATAYWYSQVLFTGIELELFKFLEKGISSPEDLAGAADCNFQELIRLLGAMERMGLVSRHKGRFYNSQTASLFLVPGKEEYMGNFFLYRQYIRPHWEDLTRKVAKGDRPLVSPPSYEERNLKYAASMDVLVRQKTGEIAKILARQKIQGPILDIGGGAGSLARAILGRYPEEKARVMDIPEVVEAGTRLYPHPDDWKGITLVSGDFRTHEFDEKFGLICLSNFLHAYGSEEAETLFSKAVSLLKPDGLVLVHDYFPDRRGKNPQKGALYDLNMMLNTYNGACHDSKRIIQWCEKAGLTATGVRDLETDTSVILARQNGAVDLTPSLLQDLGFELGLEDMIPIQPKDVITIPWAREKCRFGCDLYGKGLQCPPHGMDHEKTRALLDAYTYGFLVRGEPPGNEFHRILLRLEKQAFLEGYHKVFSFGAGPCPVCPQCPEDGLCRNPALARPSMEGSGIDVFATADRAGLQIKPVREKGQYVTYIGLVLVE